MIQLKSFAEFNALRKNQLLSFYPNIKQILDLMGGSQGGCSLEDASKRVTKYRDYYFMPQFEVGQRELVDLHHYTYDVDMCAILHKSGQVWSIGASPHSAWCNSFLSVDKAFYNKPALHSASALRVSSYKGD